MNLVNQGESSGDPSIQPEKRRRGRPRKDSSLKHAAAVHLLPGFEGVKQNLPQRADRTIGIDSMVGQAVTGVVEATFDAGYLLAVRIGNSNTNLRGVVFKPGHYVPITAENDVAPHVKMIRRNNVQWTAENQGWSQGQKLATPTAAKRKYAPLKSARSASSVPLMGMGGTVAPAVLQPLPSELQNSDHGDTDVHMVEPLSMLPPDQSMPGGQVSVATQPHPSHQVAPGSEEDDDTKLLTSSTDTDTSGSSGTSGGKEPLKSSAEDSGAVSKQETGNTNEPSPTESLQPPSVAKPFFNYGTGRMTELLQALQENMKDAQVTTTETDPENQASLP